VATKLKLNPEILGRILAWAEDAGQDGTASPETEPEPEYFSGLDNQIVKCEPHVVGKENLTLEEGRKRVADEIKAYWRDPEPEHVLLIRAAAGLGKTYAGVSFSHE